MTAADATNIELTEEQFDDQYPLIPNHFNPSAGWSFGDAGGGCLFETYGEEFDYVKRFAPDRVWTIIDGDDGDLYIVSGLHYVNRVGYLLSRDSVSASTAVQVRIPMSADNDEREP
jgi:hypothetical protein